MFTMPKRILLFSFFLIHRHGGEAAAYVGSITSGLSTSSHTRIVSMTTTKVGIVSDGSSAIFSNVNNQVSPP